MMRRGANDGRAWRGVNLEQARAPKDIKFVPLNKEKEYTAEEMMVLYKVRFIALLLVPKGKLESDADERPVR